MMCGCDVVPEDELEVRINEAFDQRPEEEVRAERIARLFAQNNRCNRCGNMVESIDDADVQLLSNYPRLVHNDICPQVAPRTPNDATAALRKMFPDAVFPSPRRGDHLRGTHRGESR